MDAYFDTNIYGHILRRQHHITNADVKKLENAVETGQLRIFTSFTVIEETNTGRLTDLEDVNGRLELIRTLTVPDQIIKHHSELLEADIRAYTNEEPLPSKFQAPYSGMQDIFWDHTAKFYKELDSYAQDTLDAVNEFTEDLNKTFNTLIRPLVKQARKEKKIQTFPEYWDEMSVPLVEQTTDKMGLLNECRVRGIDGLLSIHSVRIYTIAQVSLTYANTFERTTFHRGNSRDMHHAVCASAIPIFVTHDKPLAKVFARMPPPGLEVMDLATLLNRL
jgi:hypothetical protein